MSEALSRTAAHLGIQVTIAARIIESVAGRPQAPLRLYVGHGLDDVRRHYRQRLDGWEQTEDLTRQTLSASG